jgi:hypothetical protein
MEAPCSSETSVDFQRTTRLFTLLGRTLHNQHWENLKSYTHFDYKIYFCEFRKVLRITAIIYVGSIKWLVFVIETRRFWGN